MLVFSTQENLYHLAAADTIYCDGTFYVCPTLFYQLYTFHAKVDGTMFPLVYCFLPGKDQQMYTRLLTIIKDLCNNFNILLQPAKMFLDCEIAIRNATTSVFPDINIKGCFFHYTQCIWGNAQKHGLKTKYNEKDDIHQLVGRAAVLPLLPPNTIEDVWFNALEHIDDSDTTTLTLNFTDYVTSYWVENNQSLWNHYATEGPRTTNHLEGWHSKLKKLVKAAHPNIFSMIRLLRQEEAFHALTLIQYRAGGKRIPRKRKYREIDDRLQTLKIRLQNDELTPVEYGDAASHLLHID
ncbi:uncharacterized protein [Mytilus edulis]|uniref:uncharacterized protein n=1 Tax=Mytilus edulis TaxID=6550 RepID=UPI0039EEF412